MKKLLILLLSVLSLSVGAEQVKLALLQPRVAEGSDACLSIEINMVRGELRKAFGWQSDFQVLTRTDVDAMLKEHGFQQSGMVADAQRRQVGVMTGAQYICVSNITKYKNQLYIEAYLVDIETGQMTNPASQFANIENNDYSQLQTPCNELAKEMLGEMDNKKQRHTEFDCAVTPNEWVSFKSSKEISKEGRWEQINNIVSEYFEIEVNDMNAGIIKTNWNITQFVSHSVRTRLEVNIDRNIAFIGDKVNCSIKISSQVRPIDCIGEECYRPWSNVLNVYKDILCDLYNVLK